MVISSENTGTHGSRTASPLNLKATGNGDLENGEVMNLVATNGMATDEKPEPIELSIPDEKVRVSRKRRASDESVENSSKASESGVGEENGRDDDDDEDNEDEEKCHSHNHDPERLKAFNMFVRLFVDENLDRMVPISKQPKDKITAILEACDRQFPEFHERSRKRIRTYLKSCRRMRRSKEQNGWEQLRPTPPHLTSAAAEGLLATACENESNNAKRMRMGLEPLAASAVQTPQNNTSSSSNSQQNAREQASSSSQNSPAPTPLSNNSNTTTPSGLAASVLERQSGTSATLSNDYLCHATPTAFRPPHELPSPFFANNNGLFRPGFPSSYTHTPAHHHAPVIQHTQMANALQNGPTDLSIKKSPNSSKNSLNPTEVATIKQLIAGYRESAAFLYRSADELEQLLLQQN